MKHPEERRLPSVLIWVALILAGLALVAPFTSRNSHVGRRLCMAFASIDATNCLLVEGVADSKLQAAPANH